MRKEPRRPVAKPMKGGVARKIAAFVRQANPVRKIDVGEASFCIPAALPLVFRLIVEREDVDMQAVLQVRHPALIRMQRPLIRDDASIVILAIIVAHVEELVTCPTFLIGKRRRENLVVFSRHPDIDIVVPRYDPLVPHGAQQRSVGKPVLKVMPFAEFRESEQRPHVDSLDFIQ